MLLPHPHHLAPRSGPTHPARSTALGAPRIRVFIGDEDSEIRDALRATMAADETIDTVGEAEDGEIALQLLRRIRPDVALLDEDLPSFGGAAIARVLARELPQVRVVVMTGSSWESAG